MEEVDKSSGKQWYDAPGLNKEDESIMEKVDKSSGSLLEQLNKYFLLIFFRLVT